jgi:hypothetical protein
MLTEAERLLVSTSGCGAETCIILYRLVFLKGFSSKAPFASVRIPAFNRSPARLAAGSSSAGESRATGRDNAARTSQLHR